MNGSPSQLQVLVAGALGAGIGLAGLAFAGRGGGGRFGVSWVPGGGDDHRASPSVAGLQNLGNNCFINVILQDAAEAFQHLLHSLEEEFSEFYSPSHSSVADIFALHRRILCANGKGHNELEVWQRNFLVPFNGTLRSILTCRNCSSQEGITWSASTSSAFKQLSVGHCPEILCIQLQRVSMSVHGEMIKFQGHISFPLVLDFFPFTAAAMGMRIDMHQMPLISHPNHFVVRLGMPMLSRMYGLVDETSSLGACSGDVFTDSTNRTSGDAYMREASEPCGDNCSNLIPSKNYMYRLSSVVEHYGRSGSGHYTVYRRVRSDSDDNVPVGKSEAIYPHWVYVSDSEVSSVSEETVLAAEASLLFYEKVEVSS
ncbi:Ubiquitin carboxyl-terminal hydrolase 27 [Acorus gramineus]|uniref:ubiquitinyl hydrolase 1 n=1 Tax=Acorus gramineus TaxID=55184 RepID=A0AAV9BGI5_ACOGR|nr:Ubiquitin carboxyl-terminal hydrolase 27 [Acorus gramineus]